MEHFYLQASLPWSDPSKSINLRTEGPAPSVRPCIRADRSYNIAWCDPEICFAQGHMPERCKARHRMVLSTEVEAAPTRNQHGLADCFRCPFGCQDKEAKRIFCLRGRFSQDSYSIAYVGQIDILRERYAWCGDFPEELVQLAEPVAKPAVPRKRRPSDTGQPRRPRGRPKKVNVAA